MSSILRTSQMSPEHNNVNQKAYHTHVKNTIFDFEQELFLLRITNVLLLTFIANLTL